MNFVSLEFIMFYPIVLALYWLLAQKYRWILLLGASYFFYLYWAPWTLLLLVGTSFITFYAAKSISETRIKQKRIFWLCVALFTCLGSLFVFKYMNFFMENAGALFHFWGASENNYAWNIFLPVGISFYTFQTLSYVIDVYRGDIEVERHFGYYALFISYFPQLVAGPIERPGNLLPQLRSKNKYSSKDLLIGLQFTLRGFFKKLVIADYLATFVDQVYKTPGNANGLSIVLATILFAFQIYCDFSGYSDIAVGVARMMGIHLMRNFDNPYGATSIREFWRRWHISLTSWFSDYIYKPLGGNRKGAFRLGINIMIVFLISGLWHGASWTYILWGGIHGIYYLFGQILHTFKKKYCFFSNNKRLLEKNQSMQNNSSVQDNLPIQSNSPAQGKQSIQSNLSTYIKRSITFSLVCFAWIFFRASSLTDIKIIMHTLFSDWSINSVKNCFQIMQMKSTDIIRIILILSSLHILDRIPEWGTIKHYKECKQMECNQKECSQLEYDQKEYFKIALSVFQLITIIGIAWLSLLSTDTVNSFIYFQF